MVRDFKKVKEFLFNQSKIEDFQLIAIGSQKDHAEMCMIAYLLHQGLLDKQSKLYIGISRLCCPGCSPGIKAINEILGSVKVETTC